MGAMEASYPAEKQWPEHEHDLTPEFCHYRDEGCDLATSCLNCPFPQCIYEQPGGKQHWLKMMRNREIIRLFTREGKEIKELALETEIDCAVLGPVRAMSFINGFHQRRGPELFTVRAWAGHAGQFADR